MSNLTIVLGMHRSGTSLISAGLASTGGDFGEELMGGNQYNLKGHFEDNDIVAFNNKVLQLLGMTWDSLEFIENEYWQSKKIKALINEGVDLINKKLLLSDNSFAFKDPRTIRVLPLWLKVFDRLGIEPNYIFIVRNPVDVCNSLAKREGKPFSMSQLIWLHHNLGNISYLLNSEKLYIVDFYDFCKSPKETLVALLNNRIDSELNKSIVEFVDEFYDEKLISQQTDPYQLSENKLILPLVFNAYRMLRNIALNPSCSKNMLYELSNFWLSVGPVLCEQYKTQQIECEFFVNSLRNNHFQEIESLKSNYESKLANVCQSHKVQEALELVHHQQIKFDEFMLQSTAQASKYKAELFEKVEQLELLHKENSNLQNNLIALHETEKQVIFLQSQLRKIEKIAKNRWEVIQNQNNRIINILDSLSWRITSPLRWFGKFLK